MTEVYFTEPGHKDLLGLPKQLQDRIEEKLHEVQEAPERFLKPLRGYDLHVLRVGEHRVIVDWDRSKEVVYVHALGHRRNVHDRELR